METQPKTSAKDFFINLGAIVALYTTVVSLVNLLFTVINKSYPQINNGYNYFGSSSISWPVAIIIIFFPIFIFLMWLLGKDYINNPEKQNSGIHRWLTYITLFIAGLTIAIDLITVLYYFIDGQELTTSFLLKIFVLLVIASGVFSYYLADVRGKLTPKLRNIYRIVALVIIVGSIVWGFAVLGSPRTQQLLKYDEQKVADLSSINDAIQNFYSMKNTLPKDLAELTTINYYVNQNDIQTQKPYEYKKTGALTYDLCAEFNKDNKVEVTKPNTYARPMGYVSWVHGAGYYCFSQTINPNNIYPPKYQ
ncbi:MAG: DUF5671 domain-containing protein [Candidatus Paceibacterota bacterium]